MGGDWGGLLVGTHLLTHLCGNSGPAGTTEQLCHWVNGTAEALKPAFLQPAALRHLTGRSVVSHSPSHVPWFLPLLFSKSRFPEELGFSTAVS